MERPTGYVLSVVSVIFNRQFVLIEVHNALIAKIQVS